MDIYTDQEICPGIACIDRNPLTLTFFAFDPEFPTKKAKPKDVHSIGIMMVIVAADAPEPAPEDYVNQTAENKTIFEKFFTTSDIGMKVYIKAYYLNARNKAGPLGDAIFVIIVK